MPYVVHMRNGPDYPIDSNYDGAAILIVEFAPVSDIEITYRIKVNDFRSGDVAMRVNGPIILSGTELINDPRMGESQLTYGPEIYYPLDGQWISVMGWTMREEALGDNGPFYLYFGRDDRIATGLLQGSDETGFIDWGTQPYEIPWPDPFTEGVYHTIKHRFQFIETTRWNWTHGYYETWPMWREGTHWLETLSVDDGDPIEFDSWWAGAWHAPETVVTDDGYTFTSVEGLVVTMVGTSVDTDAYLESIVAHNIGFEILNEDFEDQTYGVLTDQRLSGGIVEIIWDPLGGSGKEGTLPISPIKFRAYEPHGLLAPVSSIRSGVGETARILASGNHDGSGTLTLTVAEDQTSSVVHLISAATAAGSTVSVAALPTDSRGGTWEDAAFSGFNDPIIGAVQDGTVGATHYVQLGQTAIRVSGDPLQIGDTVTITWNAVPTSALTIIGVLLDISEITDNAVNQYLGSLDPGDFGGIYYANGDSLQSDTSLTWATDSIVVLPYPEISCKMLSASATYPAVSDWTPLHGTKIAEIQSADGKIALGVHLANATELTAIDPGGSWGASASVLVGNYQFVEKTPVPGAGSLSLRSLKFRANE